MKTLGSIIFLLSTVLLTKDSVQWKSFHELTALNYDSKPKFILISTSWCKYCAYMKTTALENKEVISIMNKKVIPTELDAERTDDIMFHGKSFAYNEKAKTHELALALGSDEKGKMQYPTIVIVNNKNEILFQHQGAMNAEELIAVFSKL